MNNNECANMLTTMLPGIKKYRNKTIVVKYGGHAMHAKAGLINGFAIDIALLQLIGIYPVIVHGGGPQIDETLARLGKQPVFIDGLRVTDEETMEVAKWILVGSICPNLVMSINHHGGRAVGLTGKDGNLICVRKLNLNKNLDVALDQSPDLGYVGEIEIIDVSIIKALQQAQFIPVISPIGFSKDGQSYNINADAVAGKIAQALQAEKLLLMTNTAGVLDENGTLIESLNRTKIAAMKLSGVLFSGMLPKIAAAQEAAQAGIPEVNIMDGRDPHSLIQALFQETNTGTSVV